MAFFNGGSVELCLNNYGVPYVIGSYTGDGAYSKTIELGYTPSAVLILTEDKAKENSETGLPLNGGLVKQGERITSSIGAELVLLNGSTLTVKNWSFTYNGTEKWCFYNDLNTEYKYIAFRGENGFEPDTATLKDCELIAEGTTTEAVNKLIISQDTDGNAFTVRDLFFVEIITPAAEKAANTRLWLNDNAQNFVSYIGNGVNTTARHIRVIGFYRGGAWQDIYAQTAYKQAFQAANLSLMSCDVENAVTKFVFGCTEASAALPAGTEYKIYGRRA